MLTRRNSRAPDAREEGVRAGLGTGSMGLPYLPGLDGLRALAVGAVLVYHADPGWLPGGFLGVEVFFVISGYLITALLLSEWRAHGKIDLAGFWLRRARRLLPAVFAMIAATLAFAVVFLPEEVAGLRNDALAAFGYVTNWYLIFANESYFEAVGRPSLLKHLWSLAVEEQFYLLWPLLLTLGLSLGARRWRRRRMLTVSIAGAAASAVLMALLYRPDADPSRIYFGTDTRVSGLLTGAALAFLWVPDPSRRPRSGALGRLRRRWGWASPLALNAAGVLALAGLVGFFVLLDEYRPFLYRGGFALLALTTALLIAVVVHPRANPWPLELKPVRWVGVRSYGIYLWHWPIYMVTRPGLDVPLEGLPLFAVRIAITLLVADLSYRYVETPIRRGALGRAWRRWREAGGLRRREIGVRWAASSVAVLALSAALGTAVVRAEPPEKPSYLAKQEIHTKAPKSKAANDAPGKVELADAKAGRKGASVTDNKREEPGARGEAVGRVTAVGDSVMLGAASQLQEGIEGLKIIDAEVGIYPEDAIRILRSRAAAGELGDVVVVHVGENGPFSAGQFDEIMEVLKDRRAVFVNVRVPRPWEQPNNQMLAEKVAEYPNAVLVDWYSASAGRYDLFWDDGIHLRPEGAQFYADLISESLEPEPKT